MNPGTDFTSFMPQQQEMLDFTTVVAGPTVTAVGEVASYEHRLHEHEQKHSPLSLYEMETVDNPHNFQRQLMQRMFARTDVTAAPGNQPRVTLFRRLTDSLAGSAEPGAEPQVNFMRRVTDAMKDAAYGPSDECP